MPRPTENNEMARYDGFSRKYHCTFDGCSKSFKAKSSCVCHYNSKHVEKEKIMCKHCSKEFASQKSLNVHLSGNHCKGLRTKAWNIDEANQALLNHSQSRRNKRDPLRRNRMKTEKLPDLLFTLLKQYKQWEESPIGDEFRPSKIAKYTLTGYKSHIKKWIEYVTDLVCVTEGNEKDDIDWKEYEG